MGQLTDASVVLRLGYQAIRRAGLPTEEILTKAGVALGQVETNERTPLNAQYAFWVAAEEVSKDSDIGLHLGEHLPLYRGQVIEHLFVSSENFGEGLKRALAYQRLISDAFHAKLILEDGRCYLTNGVQPWAENLVNRHFSECAISGVLRFFKFLTEGQFQPLFIDFDFQEVCVSQEILSSARQVFLAADSSKFGRNAMIRLGSLKQVDCIFTDQQPNEQFIKTIRELDVGLIVAK